MPVHCIPWMRGVGENTWMQSALVLCGLLATNLALVLWQWSKPKRNAISQFASFMFWVGGGIAIFILLNVMFIGYLLGQWLID